MAELIENSGFQEFTMENLKTPEGIARLNFLIRQLAQNTPSDSESVRIFQGYGSPEASITAGIGSIYMRLDGGAGSSIYFKETGTGNTGWVTISGSVGASNSFETIAVSGQSNVVADSDTDTLTLVAGTGVTITTNAGTDTITINGSAAGITGSGTDNHIMRWDGTTAAQDSNDYIDDSGYLGINTVTPSTSLDVESAVVDAGVDINNTINDTQVVLLVHADSGTSTFTDASGYARTLTTHGGATSSTAQSVFGGASALIDDNKASFISAVDSPDWNLAGGDFTIDFWYYTNTAGGPHGIVSQWNDSGNNSSFYINQNGADLQFNYSVTNPSEFTFNSTMVLAAGAWAHIAVVRDGTTIRFFKNGVAAGTGAIGTDVLFNSTSELNISGYQSGGSADHSIDGYVDEVRIIKGRAEWTSGFTPPTAPYSVGSSPRVKFQASGTTKYTIGVDGTDNNKLKIGTTDVDTSTRLTIDSTGLVGIGQTTPTARLHLPAGTATASTSPLKLTSGTHLTTPEDGAIEYNGTHYYGTIGSTRTQLDGGGDVTGPSSAIDDQVCTYDSTTGKLIQAVGGSTDPVTLTEAGLLFTHDGQSDPSSLNSFWPGSGGIASPAITFTPLGGNGGQIHISAGSTATNTFSSSVALFLGDSSATSFCWFETVAGTSTKAPMRFSEGTLKSTKVTGIHETNSRNNLYHTNTSAERMALGGAIEDAFADSTVGGAEADIYTRTLKASLLGVDGDKVVASYSGNFVTVGTEIVQLKQYFAGTAIWDSTGIAVTTGTTSWRILTEIIRVSSTVVRYSVSLTTSGASGFVYQTTGELTGLTLSSTAIMKVTGTSSGVGSGSGDIVGKMAYIEFKPAAAG